MLDMSLMSIEGINAKDTISIVISFAMRIILLQEAKIQISTFMILSHLRWL